MFLKEFFYMTKADRRTFICLCSLALVAIIFFGAVSLTDDTSNKIEERKETATVKDESHESADGQGYAVEETTKGRSCFTSTRTLRTVRNFFNWGCVLGRFAIYISTGRGAVCINARRTLHMSMD